MTTSTQEASQRESLTLDQIRSAEGLQAVRRLMQASALAVEAKFDDRNGRYEMTGLTDHNYQRLRRTHLVAALFSSFQLDREAISYQHTIPEFVARRETLVIISTGDGGMRVYHYRS